MPSLPLLENLYFKPDEYHRRILQLIDEAQKEILVTCYIVEDDKFGKEVFQRLKKKAQQGVTVRLCVDGYGSSDWADEIVDQKKIPGCQKPGISYFCSQILTATAGSLGLLPITIHYQHLRHLKFTYHSTLTLTCLYYQPCCCA